MEFCLLVLLQELLRAFQLGTSGWNALTAFGGRTLAVIRRGQPAVKWSFRSATTFSAAQSKEQIMRHQQGQAGENW